MKVLGMTLLALNLALAGEKPLLHILLLNNKLGDNVVGTFPLIKKKVDECRARGCRVKLWVTPEMKRVFQRNPYQDVLEILDADFPRAEFEGGVALKRLKEILKSGPLDSVHYSVKLGPDPDSVVRQEQFFKKVSENLFPDLPRLKKGQVQDITLREPFLRSRPLAPGSGKVYQIAGDSPEAIEARRAITQFLLPENHEKLARDKIQELFGAEGLKRSTLVINPVPGKPSTELYKTTLPTLIKTLLDRGKEMNIVVAGPDPSQPSEASQKFYRDLEVLKAKNPHLKVLTPDDLKSGVLTSLASSEKTAMVFTVDTGFAHVLGSLRPPGSVVTYFPHSSEELTHLVGGGTPGSWGVPHQYNLVVSDTPSEALLAEGREGMARGYGDFPEGAERRQVLLQTIRQVKSDTETLLEASRLSPEGRLFLGKFLDLCR